MVLSRRTSSALRGAAALTCTLCLSWVLARGWPLKPESSVAVLGGMLVASVAVGLLHHLSMGRLRGQVGRAAQRLRVLARGGTELAAEAEDYLSPELSDLTAGIQQCAASFQQRIDQLTRENRDLRVHLRLTDTERQQAEAILDAISDAVIVTDAFDELALANQAARRLLDLDAEQHLHRPIDQVLQDPLLVKLITEARETGDPGMPGLRRHVEHKRTEQGLERYYQVSLTLLPGEARGEAAGVVAILRDVTRDREMAELKSDFVSSVSHELRTPLSSIKAYMEMLLDGEASDEQTRTEFYNVIQGEANRLSRLIDNILSINRIESGVVNVHRTHVPLTNLLQEAVELMQPQARAKHLALSLELPAGYLNVFADRDMIQQAVLNLISNAVKYTAEGGRVTVRLGADAARRCVNISVSDNGVGIPAQDMGRVFEKFYRVNDHKKLAKGSGLGLNLVKQIVEIVHGGRITVHSQVGQGSTFTITLPLPESDPTPKVQEEAVA